MKKTMFIAPIALLAILCGCAVNNRELAGRINGTPIPYDAYIDAYRGHYNNFYTLNNRAPGIDEKNMITRETWRNISIDVILKDQFRKYGISATADETLDTLRSNPPKYIVTSPLFRKGDRFDQQLYLQSLLYDTPENLQPVRSRYQTYLIPIMKLKDRLIDKKLLTSAEKKRIAKVLNGSADVKLTVIDSQSFDPVISSDEIRSRYERDLNLYRLEPYYRLDYLKLKVNPSIGDTEFSIAVADTLWQDLVSGNPLADAIRLRQQYFPQITLKNSGFIRNGDLDPKVYELLISLGEGGFSAPLTDSEGITIYQLEQLTKSMSSFNTIRIPYLAGTDSVEQSRTKAERVWRLAVDIGLAEAASELELDIFPTGKLRPDQPWHDDPQVVKSILDQIANKSKRFVCQPVYSESEGLWILAEVAENQLNSLKPLNEVESAIKATLVAEKRYELAEKTARQYLAGQPPAAGNSEVLLLKGMSTTTVYRDLKLNHVYYDAVRRYLDKDPVKYYQLGGLFLIPQVLSFTRSSQNHASELLIRTYFVNSLPEDWFDTWLEGQIKKARVRIFVKQN